MSTSFETLGLRAELVRAVADEGYTQPTPIQVQAIPVVLKRRDVFAGAQTGTGKTAGFVLPMLQLLAEGEHPAPRPKSVRALIVAPTRELAAQVEASVRAYGRHLRLRSAAVFGGVNITPQERTLRHGVDVLVATPGRLLDHVRSRTVDLSQVEILVLDEADRMLDMGFIHDIRRILSALPKQRQNLFFSATFSSEIRRLADSFLRSPVEVAVARQQVTADLVTHLVHPVDKSRKRALLSYLIGSGNWRQVLVFTRTKHGANRLAEQLDRDGIDSVAIHGNKSQGARTRALAQFKDGGVRVLVATDIAARGLDIELLPHVVNYELPSVPEEYLHRIGRTGRAGSSGVAVSLVCGEENGLLADIERVLKRRVERVAVAGFEPGTAKGKSEDGEEMHRSRAAQRRAPQRSGAQPRRNAPRKHSPSRLHSQVRTQDNARGRPAAGHRNGNGADVAPGGGRRTKSSGSAHTHANAQRARADRTAERSVPVLFGGNGTAADRRR
ncbi:MAG: DEAD/DEAH box helicase [Burkholderiales bacterium]